MKRTIEQSLVHWKNNDNRSPLLLRGARQVGKTYIIEKFGKEHFENMIKINFDLNPEYCKIFDNLEPNHIINSLGILAHLNINRRIFKLKTIYFYWIRMLLSIK